MISMWSVFYTYTEHEMSSGTKENEQHRQHEDVSTDSAHLPNESLQTMNGNTSTHKEQVASEHKVSNITQNKRQHCEQQHTTSDKKGLNKVITPVYQ